MMGSARMWRATAREIIRLARNRDIPIEEKNELYRAIAEKHEAEPYPTLNAQRLDRDLHEHTRRAFSAAAGGDAEMAAYDALSPRGRKARREGILAILGEMAAAGWIVDCIVSYDGAKYLATDRGLESSSNEIAAPTHDEAPDPHETGPETHTPAPSYAGIGLAFSPQMGGITSAPSKAFGGVWQLYRGDDGWILEPPAHAKARGFRNQKSTDATALYQWAAKTESEWIQQNGEIPSPEKIEQVRPAPPEPGSAIVAAGNVKIRIESIADTLGDLAVWRGDVGIPEDEGLQTARVNPANPNANRIPNLLSDWMVGPSPNNPAAAEGTVVLYVPPERAALVFGPDKADLDPTKGIVFSSAKDAKIFVEHCMRRILDAGQPEQADNPSTPDTAHQ